MEQFFQNSTRKLSSTQNLIHSQTCRGWNKDIFRPTRAQYTLRHEVATEELTETMFEQNKGIKQEGKPLGTRELGDGTEKRV